MAEHSAADRTEKPTPERLRKARKEGQVAQSQEVSSALITIIVVVVLAVLAPNMGKAFYTMVTQGISAAAEGPSGGEVFKRYFHLQASEALVQMAPLLVVCGLMSCFSSVIVSGLTYSPKVLKLDWSKINPAKGVKNVISLQSLMRLFMAILKMTVIGIICYLYLNENISTMLELRWASPVRAAAGIASLIFGLMVRVCVMLLIIAGIDYVFQKWNLMKKLRMTKQEVKEERKQYEVAPEIKGRIRQIQYEMVRKRMLQDVPTADVVVTNPTHYAVALKYDMEAMDAPIVVAKGPDELAKRIKDIAREHQVPIIERPVLARALYSACEIGHPIPSNLFVAVAEVLAMIYKLRKKRRKKYV
ncbi:MAG: flagellar biosynthesis protein FlhB [Phycisphaerae bacterium]|nr:flagellar biosynthesis protein FlhB [Phycisphaerae bacterium]